MDLRIRSTLSVPWPVANESVRAVILRTPSFKSLPWFVSEILVLLFPGRSNASVPINAGKFFTSASWVKVLHVVGTSRNAAKCETTLPCSCTDPTASLEFPVSWTFWAALACSQCGSSEALLYGCSLSPSIVFGEDGWGRWAACKQILRNSVSIFLSVWARVCAGQLRSSEDLRRQTKNYQTAYTR